MTEKEFLDQKEAYVGDVLEILDKRAEAEANLIFRRYREGEGKLQYTDISSGLASEINDHYADLFSYFQDRPQLADGPLFRKVLLNHLPAFIQRNPKYKGRVKNLPPKIKYAVLASEIASSIVYLGGWEIDFDSQLKGYMQRQFA